jgi:hypothetical protein
MHLFAAVLKIAFRCEMMKARAQAWAFCCWFEQPSLQTQPFCRRRKFCRNPASRDCRLQAHPGHFNTIEVAGQVNAMIERFLAVGLSEKALPR